MKVKVKKLVEGAKLPEKTYGSDFCYDCYATSVEEVAKDTYKYGIGLAFQIERDIEKLDNYLSINFKDAKNVRLSLDFRPRSSVYKTGLSLCNCEGTIDENYTAQVSAIFYHINKEMPIYKVGEKIGQVKLGLTFDIDWVEVDELNETDRGQGGFGSTGK